jgi:CheY-like chemotaxis protein
VATLAIIDNDEDSRDVLQVLMETEGHSVEQFASGKDFLSKFRPGNFKLILVDLSMPGMDGYELLKLVRAQDPRIPVMAVTGRAFDVDRAQAHTAGFSAFVTKPFTDLATFFDLILKHLRADSN